MCPDCKRLKGEVAWAQECIVELQHVIRELRHENANLAFITAAQNEKAAQEASLREKVAA